MVVLLFAGAAHARAHAAGLPDVGTCVQTEQGHVSIDPGSPTSVRPYTAAGTTDAHCRLPDPTIHSGTAAWSLSGTFQCLPPLVTASGTISYDWSNGRTSAVQFHANVVGGVDFNDGVVVSGEFTGMHVSWRGIAANPFAGDASGFTGVLSACGGQRVTDVAVGNTLVAVFR